jgi:Flp pilus assembly secretin CpaC
MRYLSFLAAVLASAPAYAAEFTHKIELPPGFAERWQAPRPFKSVILGDPDIVDAIQGQTNRELIIITKPDGGTTNIVLNDENGEQVANVLVTNPAIPTIQYPLARSVVTGRLQLYRNMTKQSGDKGMGDADSISVTRNKDGSTSTWKNWTTPPKPPTP